MRPSSLSRRVTLFSTAALAAVWAIAVVLMSAVLWTEQDELFDQQLVETAHALLPLVSGMETEGADATARQKLLGLDEALIYRLYGRTGSILRQSELAAEVELPPITELPMDDIETSNDYRIYATPYNVAGHALQIAAPLAERREGFREGIAGFLLPMLALLPLTWLIVGWVTRRALAPMRELEAEISSRDRAHLEMIDTGDWPSDLVHIAGVMNGFMARLSQALDAERAFASNAAHELRTPVAIALAQTQQLRETLTDTAELTRLAALERALQRMRRLVARLLQLARADAGIGVSAVPHDLTQLTRMIVEDFAPSDANRLTVDLPAAPVMARIDPDAFGILLSNLLDNAAQHAPMDSPISVRLTPDAVVEIANGGPVVQHLESLSHRFAHRSRDGFGLGLHIVAQIAEQAGGALELVSPRPGKPDGFLARIRLQLA